MSINPQYCISIAHHPPFALIEKKPGTGGDQDSPPACHPQNHLRPLPSSCPCSDLHDDNPPSSKCLPYPAREQRRWRTPFGQVDPRCAADLDREDRPTVCRWSGSREEGSVWRLCDPPPCEGSWKRKRRSTREEALVR